MSQKVRKVFIVLLCLIILGCMGYLVWHYMSASEGESSYERAKEVADKKTEPEEQQPEVEEPEAEVQYVNFDALQAVNPDVYAWIEIAGTNIDYPIVQSQTNQEFYLNHTWEGNYAEQGAIFTQTYNSRDFTDFNTVIYGHRMGDGNVSMFHELRNYMDAQYLKTHQDIVIYTRGQKRVYRVFAAVVYDDRLIPAAFDFMKEEERQAFLESVYASRDMRNQFADNVEVTAEDRILTLSTCLKSESRNRFLVEAVLISEE